MHHLRAEVPLPHRMHSTRKIFLLGWIANTHTHMHMHTHTLVSKTNVYVVKISWYLHKHIHLGIFYINTHFKNFSQASWAYNICTCMERMIFRNWMKVSEYSDTQESFYIPVDISAKRKYTQTGFADNHKSMCKHIPEGLSNTINMGRTHCWKYSSLLPFVWNFIPTIAGEKRWTW